MTIATLTGHKKILSTTVNDLLGQIEQSGTPIRIENDTETYYLLRIDQLLGLLQLLPFAEETNSTLTAADFGLSEADIAAYHKRRAQRRKRIQASGQQTLDRQLQRRLEKIKQQSAMHSKKEVAEMIEALETAMLHNLQTSLSH